MLVTWAAATGAALVAAAALSWGGSAAAADVDVSGTWDVNYSLTCTAVFNQQGAELTAAVDCGAGAAGTMEGSADTADGTFSLSGGLGLIMVSLEGFIVDDDSLGGTFSAFPLAEEETFIGVRADTGSGTGLSGEWVLTLEDVLSGGCTVEIEQAGADLGASLVCESLSKIAFEGTLDGSAVTLSGPFTDISDILLEATLSEDGGAAEGIWQVGPETSVEITGSFTATLRGGPRPTAESTPTPVPEESPDVPATDVPATDSPVVDLPATGTGLRAAAQSRATVQAIAALTTFGAFAVAGGWLAKRRKAPGRRFPVA